MKNLLLGALVSLLLWNPAQAAPDLEEILARFEPYAQKSLQEWGTPGMAVAIVVKDQVVYTQGFGVRQVGGTEPVTPETIFQIGSISKSFTSALVGQLVDQGAVDWTSRVCELVPEFQMYDPWVTREFMVEDTMSQRSGMAPYAGDLLAFLGRDRKEMVQAIRHIEPVSSLRSRFAYVNNLWLVAALVIEAKTGQSWEQAVQTRLFEPLGMTSSSTGWDDFYGAANRAVPHARSSQGLVPLTREWPFSKWVYSYGPAGGINSNVLDMTGYARMQLHGTVDGRQLLSRQTLDKLHSPHIFAGGKTVHPATAIFEVGAASYCLGWLRQEVDPQPIVWHNGGTSGSKAVLGLLPDSEVAIVVLTNLADTELPEALMYRFYDLYLERPEQDYSANFLRTRLAQQTTPPVRPAKVLPPMPLSRYVGTYHHPVYGSVVVRVDGDGLTASLTPAAVIQLRPWNRDTFVFVDFSDPGADPQFATFQLGNDGEIEALKIDSLFSSPGGLFRRSPVP
jgi:CubicO group peptidase (beta-lactamase class C family)